MAILIGTDEAGYGPNLGPLVIGASAWRIPDTTAAETLYEVLHACVTDQPHEKHSPVPMADSKALYQPSRGTAVLEAATLAAWQCAGLAPRSWSEAWTLVAGDGADPQLAWHTEFDPLLPHVAAGELVAAWSECLANGLRAAEIELSAVRARVVQPSEFNARVTKLGSKGALLSETTLQLAADILRSLNAHADESVLILCDKHGGRDRYSAVLMHVFPDAALTVLKEGRAESRYCLQVDGRKIEFRFQTKGERFLPAALASMTAKYLRELGMAAFNAYWVRQIPGLKPTAGYPLDAARFRRDIAATLATSGIAEDHLWRQR